MKLVMIFDQIQAGAGGKEKANTPLVAKKGPIGSCKMFESSFKQFNIEVLATMYCGDAYYVEHRQEVQKKMIAMIKNLSPDAVLCGPAFNYAGYAQMAVEMCEQVQSICQIPVVAACSKENEEVIQSYKDKIKIVEMPKKGGIGLNDSLHAMSNLLDQMYQNKDVCKLVETLCY